ncbi:MAG: hypothetical protein RLY93_03740 [Sumerlaeia bacterium]
MSREARLLHSTNRFGNEAPDADAEVLFFCEDGIPLSWFLCFGGRNVWELDEKVEERGGTSADRNRFETPLEVAEGRLAHAIEGLSETPHLWVWYASLELLRRRIIARGRKGFLRLDANWAFQSGEQRESITTLPALMENMVNQTSNGQFQHIGTLLKPAEGFAPFVPLCAPEDKKRFEKAKAYRSLAGSDRATALMTGLPPDSADRYLERAREIHGPEFAKLGQLGPYPGGAGSGGGEGGGGLMGKLKGMFGRKS